MWKSKEKGVRYFRWMFQPVMLYVWLNNDSVVLGYFEWGKRTPCLKLAEQQSQPLSLCSQRSSTDGTCDPQPRQCFRFIASHETEKCWPSPGSSCFQLKQDFIFFYFFPLWIPYSWKEMSLLWSIWYFPNRFVLLSFCGIRFGGERR